MPEDADPSPVDEGSVARWFAALLGDQADWCEQLESPLYAGLLRRLAQDAAARGPTFRVLAGHETDRKLAGMLASAPSLSARAHSRVRWRKVRDRAVTDAQRRAGLESAGDPGLLSRPSDPVPNKNLPSPIETP